MSDWTRVRYDQPADRVARITLARPEAANAQDYLMLSELNEAFDRAARDDDVRVIVLAADGKHFSSGHDLRDVPDMGAFEPVGTQCHFDADGAEGYMAREAEMYVGMCWRWRNIPKPTIASVQGKVIAGGLMLVWPMDMIVCSDDATFSDPVVAFGVNGHEYFAEPVMAMALRLFAETGPDRSLSCGIAFATPDVASPGELLRAADEAQYEQKRLRKGLPPLTEVDDGVDRRRTRRGD